jgi:hypothetical protein
VADPVAIIGIVSGATVALGVPFINYRFDERRMERQRRDARLSELRELLDDAVIHLFAGYNVLYLIGQERHKELRGAEWSQKRLRQLGEELRQEAILCGSLGLRVKLRTPRGAEVSQRQDAANRIFLDYEFAYRMYVEADLLDTEKPPDPPDREAFEAIRALIMEIRDFAGVVESPPVTQERELLRAIRSVPDRLTRSRGDAKRSA